MGDTPRDLIGDDEMIEIYEQPWEGPYGDLD